MSDGDLTPKPFVRLVLPYVIVIGIFFVIGLLLLNTFANQGQSSTAVSASTVTVGAPETSTSPDVQLDFCDFTDLGPSIGDDGYVLGCQMWQETANPDTLYGLKAWNWAGVVAMIGTSNPPCKSLELTFYPNTWGSNSVVVTSDKQVAKTVRIGPPGSLPVVLKLPLDPGSSQFRLNYDKTWSPLVEDGIQDARNLSNVTLVRCGA